MTTGTEKNPIHQLEAEHLIGLSDTTVYYEEVSYKLNLFWAKDYCIEHNVKLKRIKKEMRRNDGTGSKRKIR